VDEHAHAPSLQPGGRNRALRTQSFVGWSNAGWGLFKILIDAGSTRPVVSMTAGRTTRP